MIVNVKCVDLETSKVTYTGLTSEFSISESGLEISTSEFTLDDFTGKRNNIVLVTLVDNYGNLMPDQRGTIDDMWLNDYYPKQSGNTYPSTFHFNYKKLNPKKKYSYYFYYGVITNIQPTDNDSRYNTHGAHLYKTSSVMPTKYTVTTSDIKHMLDFDVVLQNDTYMVSNVPQRRRTKAEKKKRTPTKVYTTSMIAYVCSLYALWKRGGRIYSEAHDSSNPVDHYTGLSLVPYDGERRFTYDGRKRTYGDDDEFKAPKVSKCEATSFLDIVTNMFKKYGVYPVPYDNSEYSDGVGPFTIYAHFIGPRDGGAFVIDDNPYIKDPEVNIVGRASNTNEEGATIVTPVYSIKYEDMTSNLNVTKARDGTYYSDYMTVKDVGKEGPLKYYCFYVKQSGDFGKDVRGPFLFYNKNKKRIGHWNKKYTHDSDYAKDNKQDAWWYNHITMQSDAPGKFLKGPHDKDGKGSNRWMLDWFVSDVAFCRLCSAGSRPKINGVPIHGSRVTSGKMINSSGSTTNVDVGYTSELFSVTSVFDGNTVTLDTRGADAMKAKKDAEDTKFVDLVDGHTYDANDFKDAEDTSTSSSSKKSKQRHNPTNLVGIALYNDAHEFVDYWYKNTNVTNAKLTLDDLYDYVKHSTRYFRMHTDAKKSQKMYKTAENKYLYIDYVKQFYITKSSGAKRPKITSDLKKSYMSIKIKPVIRDDVKSYVDVNGDVLTVTTDDDETMSDIESPSSLAAKNLELPEYSHEISFKIRKDLDQYNLNRALHIGNYVTIIYKGEQIDSHITGYTIDSSDDWIEVKCGNFDSNLRNIFSSDKSNAFSDNDEE